MSLTTLPYQTFGVATKVNGDNGRVLHALIHCANSTCLTRPSAQGTGLNKRLKSTGIMILTHLKFETVKNHVDVKNHHDKLGS